MDSQQTTHKDPEGRYLECECYFNGYLIPVEHNGRDWDGVRCPDCSELSWIRVYGPGE